MPGIVLKAGDSLLDLDLIPTFQVTQSLLQQDGQWIDTILHNQG